MKMQNAKTIYDDDLAYIHDVGFSGLAESWAPGLLAILRKAGIDEGLVVDLGCGGGGWVEHLVKAGYRAVGVDISPAMIDLAHQRVPHAELQVDSIWNYSIPRCRAVDYAGGQPWIGFHDDMFPEDTDNGKDWSFLSGLRASGRTGNWKKAVVGGEMVPGKAKRWLGQDYETTVTMLERAHFTWVGPYCPPLERSSDEEFRRRSQALVRKMGYEFQLTELRHTGVAKTNDPIDISLKGQNNGGAPFYYPWSVEWALMDSAGRVVTTQQTPWDLRNWQPGSFAANAKVTFDVRPGEYRLALGIRDPWQNRPAIRFANQSQAVDGWTVLSKLKITR